MATIILLICIMNASLRADVFRVPSDYPSIQAAINATQEDDTVLVAPATYAEALSIPSRGLYLLGDTVPDTGDYPRPIVDPSSLSNPGSRACMVTGSSELRCEDFVFRNGTAMYPRQNAATGGILNTGTLHLRRCLFDSTYDAIRSWDDYVSAQHCRFVDCQHTCVFIAEPLIATDCDFSGHCAETLVQAQARSRFTRCHFHDNTAEQGVLLILSYDSCVVEDCIFGPQQTPFNRPVRGSYLSNGRIERNIFTDIVCNSDVLTASGMWDSPLVIRDNHFINLRSPENANQGLCALVATCGNWDTCSGPVVENNFFEDIHGGPLRSKGIILGNTVVTHNRFVNILPAELITVSASVPGSMFRNNMFWQTGIAVAANYSTYWGFTAEADSNWWGDATGPYHSILNPLGQGDEVGDSVHFIPWHADTAFWYDYNSAPARPLLPEQFIFEAYPNPFNSTVTLKLIPPEVMIVRVELFDILGRRVRELWSGPLAFEKQITFDGQDLASGIYFARVWQPIGNRPLALTKLVLMK